MAPPASTIATALALFLLLAAITYTAGQSSSSSSSSHGHQSACPDKRINLAALSSSSSSSSSSTTTTPPTTCRVLIVGGGAGGIFSAYMLRELSSSVCVVEKQKVWGGKLQNIGPSEAAAAAAANSSSASDTADHASIGTAGLWIHGSQKDISEPLLTMHGGRYPAPAFNLTDTDGHTKDPRDRLWDFLLGRSY
uniref:Uncharacterized protein n=1 Tax=Tetradesmus obliquus TaxID=3088 RepID=A0A383VZ74_TETOB|eukprot:jgi/Sobl393_1/15172/SZX70747.1